MIVLKSSIELGAFGGVNENKDKLYLGIGANGKVQGILQIPSNFFIPCLRGAKLSQTDIQLIIGGQTTARISGISVSEGMKQALNNIDAYLGAMAQTQNRLFGVRVWVLVPKVLQTNFRYKEGWGIEGALITKLPEWDWSSKGVEPVVQAISLEDGEEFAVMLAADPPDAEPRGGGNSQEITVYADADETPYILLAFENTVTEEEIQNTLSVTKKDESNRIDINWVGKDGEIDPTAEINAGIDLIKNKDDGKEYRVALLRLKDGGTYVVNTGALDIQKSQKATVTPFEKLDLSLNSGKVTGQVEYAEMNTEYTLRTYLAEKEGGADYLIDEQIGAVDKVTFILVLTNKKDAHRRHPACFIIRFRFNAVADKRQWSSAASKPRRKTRAKLCSRFCAENEPSHQTCRSFSASRYSGLERRSRLRCRSAAK